MKEREEGGYFSLFYKSSDKVILLNEKNSKNQKYKEYNAASSIYFLLNKEDFSAWHRLKSDEIWHYYDGGSPIDIHVIEQDDQLKTYTLGNPSVTENASFQVVIKAGAWFTAEVHDKTTFALVGCTVSPAFEYDDFEVTETCRDKLVKSYPCLASILDKFSKPLVVKSIEQTHDHTITNVINKLSAQNYIRKFKLKKHEEGGYFSVNYKSTDEVIPLDSRYANRENDKKSKEIYKETYRSAGSAIYFLLNKEDFSAWHRLKSDEIWHYYDGGSPIDIHVIEQDDQLKTYTLGNPSVTENASFQVVIKAGAWFAAEVHDKTTFALVGCTVSPAFEYDDFALANREYLIAQYPAHESIINRFTRVARADTSSWATKAFTYAGLALVSGIGFYALARGNESIKSCLNKIKIKIGM